MLNPWRGLALAAALTIIVGAGTATAQTVIVRNAPPGAAVELVFNLTPAGTATANATGEATISLKAFRSGAANTATDVHAYVDACEKVRRVFLIERGLQPAAPEAGCTRTEVPGWFVLRNVTTLVVDVGPAEPAVWVRQGPAPPEWLTGTGTPAAGPSLATAPTGLVLSGGGGLTKFDNIVSVACGNAADCSGRSFKATYVLGVSYWLTRFLAGEVTYVRPSNVSVTGSDFGYHFASKLDAQMFTVGGKVGIPVRAVRVYGVVGGTFHDATLTTDQTIDETTVTVDDVVQKVAGGTQTIEMKTDGWGWFFGGGIEGWVTPRIGIYGEARRAALKGKVLGGGEGQMNERATILHVGIRVHLGMH